MATPPPDDKVEHTLLKSRMVTWEQIEAAKAEQSRLSESGKSLPLADVLVSQNVITDAIRENVIEAANSVDPDVADQIGPFKIIKKLGEGGMGSVYLAEDPENKRQVALKVLPEKFAKKQEHLSRFRREARAASQLRHANIAVALAEGEEKGVHYYAMEYCEGDALDDIRRREMQFPVQRAIDIVIQVATGLKYAHEHGIVHRDIKPANIFVGDSGIVKILDMGLSKDLDADEQSYNTQTGAVLGTAHYISPEQAKGEKVVDGRADIYSLGATFYNLITGKTPFHGATPALIMMKHLTEQLPNPQDLVENVPDGVVQIIRKMMAKDAGDRYRNCDELLQDLEAVKAGREPEFATLDEAKSNVLLRKVRTAGPGQITLPMSAPQAPGLKKWHAVILVGSTLAAVLLIWIGWRGLQENVEIKVAPATIPVATPVVVVKDAASIADDNRALIKEDFETVDLDKRRDDWKIVEHTAFSIVDISGHGKVLKLDTSGKRPRQPQLDIPLKVSEVGQRTLDGTFNAKSHVEGGAKSGAMVTIYRVDSTGTIFREKGAEIETSSTHWTTYRFKQPPLTDAKEIFVRVEATADVGEVLIDDIKLTIEP